MGTRPAHDPHRPGAGRGLASYILAWLLAGTVVVAGAVLLLDRGARSSSGTVALPPVRETALTTAAHKAGCLVTRRPRGAVGLALPARAGVYDRPLGATDREAALRRGLIVIEYRGVDSRTVDELRTVQEAVPVGTLLAPSIPFADDELTVSAYRRRLSCHRMSSRAIDAVRLFRGRYLGTAAAP
jgi:hypothetical protein